VLFLLCCGDCRKNQNLNDLTMLDKIFACESNSSDADAHSSDDAVLCSATSETCSMPEVIVLRSFA
jgi:hypothetical protein